MAALTGASGCEYGLRLVEELLAGGAAVDLIVSKAGLLILEEEAGLRLGGDQRGALRRALEARRRVDADALERLACYGADELTAPAASGSSRRRAMVVCPCSMGTLARIASGASGNLIERAADCMLKERRPLIVVPRETPLGVIHLENMLRLARAGAVVLPAMPAFYTKPEKISHLVDFVVGKILDSLNIDNNLYQRWKQH
ncbi:MAG TPA: UbiX family flavin prenyltransferase [Deltaproteobacteria bacterium]|nr:UbiX family flavin prenyltransferase [Deltaproteobacteria bacterium]